MSSPHPNIPDIEAFSANCLGHRVEARSDLGGHLVQACSPRQIQHPEPAVGDVSVAGVALVEPTSEHGSAAAVACATVMGARAAASAPPCSATTAASPCCRAAEPPASQVGSNRSAGWRQPLGHKLLTPVLSYPREMPTQALLANLPGR